MRLSAAKIFFYLNLLFILAVFIMGFRPGAFRPDKEDLKIAAYNGQSLSFTGRVCEEADVGISNRRLTVCASGRVLVTTDLYPAYDYGDFLSFSGRLQTPPEVDGFDYEAYLARYDIYSVMYYPAIRRTEGASSGAQKVYRGLIQSKQKLKTVIDSHLPEPEAGLASAILLGYRRTLDREDLDMFARVGLSHLIAISGSHITILSAIFMNIFLALGASRRLAGRGILIFLFLYPLITGLSASAVRSSVMGGLAFLAVFCGRLSSLTRALFFSASLMLAINPRLLRDDVGFQLSFLALLGIIYLYPVGERIIRRRLEKSRLKHGAKKTIQALADIANLTLVCQLAILPVALINFRQLSLIAPLANILALWTFPPLLISLIFGLAATAICPPLGLVWFFPAYLLLKFLFALAGFLAVPDWAAIEVTSVNWPLGTMYYIILAGIASWLGRRRSVRRRYLP